MKWTQALRHVSACASAVEHTSCSGDGVALSLESDMTPWRCVFLPVPRQLGVCYERGLCHIQVMGLFIDHDVASWWHGFD